MSRGGKREGAGRPRREADALDVKTTIRTTAAEAEALRAFAAARKVSTSEAARQMVVFYLGSVGAE
jgi:hypothetical protein